jgi:hypothetical protein
MLILLGNHHMAWIRVTLIQSERETSFLAAIQLYSDYRRLGLGIMRIPCIFGNLWARFCMSTVLRMAVVSGIELSLGMMISRTRIDAKTNVKDDFRTEPPNDALSVA